MRKKDGVELSLDYMTTINQLRQKIQAVVKPNLEDIGFKVELKQIDADVFFDSAAGNDQNNTHFYNDLNMFTVQHRRPAAGGLHAALVRRPGRREHRPGLQPLDRPQLPALQQPGLRRALRRLQTESDPDKAERVVHQHERHPVQRCRGAAAGAGRNKIAVSRTLNQENLAPSPTSSTTGTSPTGTA